jgi:DNA-binding LacI/PurR family transcriptional regulator
VGALVVAPARKGEASTELEMWIRDRLPVVLYGHSKPWRLSVELAARCDQVDMDNRGGVEQAVRYLISLGHRDIAFLCAQPLTETQRYEPFVETIRAAGISGGPDRCLGELPDGKSGALQAVSRFRAQGSFPTAVFCASDMQALDLMEALEREGLRCPADVSIVGFGDRSSDGVEGSSRLTRADYNSDTAAVETVRLMRKQFAGDVNHPERVEIPVRLVIKESAGPPPARS